MAPTRLAIIGVGKIVRDQHAPVLAASSDFELVATSSPHSTLDGVPAFKTPAELFSNGPPIDAVAVTSTTDLRHDIAREAIAAGKHVLLEKPPATTQSALDDLDAAATAAKRVLYASWHSRFAPQVEAARAWLSVHAPTRMEVEWREDVRRWHPGQAWIWEAGGLGVFDPGVNALSVLTEIAPWPVFLQSAELAVPSNKQTPISAKLALSSGSGVEIKADFDWTGTGDQTWEIRAETPDGALRLYEGGARLQIDGRDVPTPGDADPDHAEYIGVYGRFAALLQSGESEVDDRPLRIAADAFLVGRRTAVAAFDD